MRDISIRTRAYKKLKEQQNSDETMSDVVERLAGSSSGGGSGVSQLSSRREEKAEQLASRVVTGIDLVEIQERGVSRREYLAAEFGVDPADYTDEGELLADLRENR